MEVNHFIYLSSIDSYKSILAFDCEAILEGHGKNTINQLQDFIDSNPNRYIFGFLTYELKDEIENLKSQNPAFVPFPKVGFILPKIVVSIIHQNQIEYLYGSKTKESEEFIRDFLNQENNNPLNRIEVRPTLDKSSYLKKIESLQQEIQQGNIYEVTFCQDFQGEGTIEPIPTYFELNRATLAPFSCFVKWKDSYLLSGSPERFIKKKGEKVLSQPIKGTSKRGRNSMEDALLKEELLNSKKERAENVMIVDLVRNDLSKIARRNTVKVDELFGLYSFKTVHQMISTISCKIESTDNFTSILKALFPMGSMTGAPKIRAMELIEEHENFKRGIYSGSVGYIKPNGDFDFNVVIRSILYNETLKRISCPVGGAITIQSSPEKEFEECLTKVKALKKVLHSNE